MIHRAAPESRSQTQDTYNKAVLAVETARRERAKIVLGSGQVHFGGMACTAGGGESDRLGEDALGGVVRSTAVADKTGVEHIEAAEHEDDVARVAVERILGTLGMVAAAVAGETVQE
jgi:hypothetical protein